MTSLLVKYTMNMQSKLGKGGNKMDKDRILEQVRTENIDEGVEHIKNKGLGIGYMIFLALSIIIMIFNLFTGQKTYSVQSLFWGFIAAENHSLYRFSGDKSNKFGAICAGIACVVFLIGHILYSLG